MLARMEWMEAKMAQEIIESVKQEGQANMLLLTALDMSINPFISSPQENLRFATGPRSRGISEVVLQHGEG